MPSKTVKADANFQGIITELAKVLKAMERLAAGQEKLAKSSGAILRAINSQSSAYERLAKAQQKAIAGNLKAVTSQKKISAVTAKTNKQIQAQKDKIKEQTLAQARQTKAIDRRLNQGYTKEFMRGTGATFDEQLNYKNQQAAFNKFVSSNKIGLEQVNSMWKRLATGDIRAYQGTLGKLQNNLVALRKSQVALGTSARKMNDAQTDAWAKSAGLTGRMSKGMGQVNNAVQRLTLSWKSLVRLLSVQLFHQAISLLVRTLAEGVKTTIELEKRIGEVQTISQNLPLSLNQWFDGLKNLSDIWGISVLNQAEAAYQALSNQVVEGAATLDFLSVANKFATVAVTDASTAVNLLTSALNAFNLSTLDSERISSQFFKTIELGRVRAEEMATAFGRIAVPAAKLGIRIQELNAAISASTIQGFKYSEAATSIRNVFLKLIKPTDAMKKFFHELGVTSGEALIGAYGFAGALEQLDKKVGGSSTELGELLGRLRAMMGGFLLTGEGLRKFQDNLKQIEDATESYNKALDRILEKPGKQLDIQLNRIKNYFLAISKATIDWIALYSDNFRNITIGVKALADALSILAFAIMPKLVAMTVTWMAAMAPLYAIPLLAAGIVGIFTLLARTVEDNRAKIDELTLKNQQGWADQRLEHIQEIFDEQERNARAIDKIERQLLAQSSKKAYVDIEKHGAVYKHFRKNIAKFEKAIGKVIKTEIKILKNASKDLTNLIAEQFIDPEDTADFINERRKTGLDRPDRLEPETERLYEHAVSGIIEAENRLRQAVYSVERVGGEAAEKAFGDASESMKKFATDAIKYSDKVFEEGGTGAIRSGELYYTSWLQVIADQERILKQRAARERDQIDLETKGHEKNLAGIKKEVEAVKEITIQELLNEDDPDKVRAVFKRQEEALNNLKKKAKLYNVEFDDLGILETELGSLKIFYIAKIQQIRNAAHEKHLNQLEAERKAIQKRNKDLYQVVQTLMASTGEALLTTAKTTIPLLVNYIRTAEDGEKGLDALREGLHKAEIKRLNEQIEKRRELKNLQERQKLSPLGGGASAGRTSIIRRAAGGPAGIDTQMVAMSPQEMIMNPRASRHFFSTLTAINSGFQRFAGGGAPVTYNVGDINLHPQKASDVDVLAIGQKMRREIKRGRMRLS
jgi:TP901 family phage tail tape measure protein